MNNFLSLDKQLVEWEKYLEKNDPHKIYLISHAIQNEAARLADKKMKAINTTIQTSITAALITEFDFSVDDAGKVFKKADDYIEEAEPILKFYKEDYEMVVKKDENKIKERVKVLLLGGKSQIQVIALLKNEFTNISSQDLVLLYKQAEKEFNKRSEAIEKDKVNSEGKNKTNTAEKKVGNKNIPKEKDKVLEKGTGMKKEEIKSKFEVVEQTLTLKGEFGTYIKTKEGVQAGQEYFKDGTRVDKYRQAEKDKADKQLQARLDELEKQKEMLIKEHDEESQVFELQIEEIKAVFAY